MRQYNGVSVTIYSDGRAFADYPLNEKIIKKVGWRFPTTTRILSDKKRYRVYYKKNEVSKVYADIEAVMLN